MRDRSTKILAVLMVSLMAVVALAPLAGEETDAAVGDGGAYSYTLTYHADQMANTAAQETQLTVDGMTPISHAPGDTTLTSLNEGSWSFDTTTGIGPFNSFYGAFDIDNGNKFVARLNPYDLSKTIDGASLPVGNYNIMWVLPTVYWSVDQSGNLTLTNDSTAGGTAYAHTINGHTYNYIAIGVYEGTSYDSNSVLTSETGKKPYGGATRATLRTMAHNYTMDDSLNTDPNNPAYSMLLNFYQMELYRYCSLIVMEGFNSQAIVGNGMIGLNSIPSTYTNGSLDSLGPYAGMIGLVNNSDITTYGSDMVKLFIENSWGGYSELVDGVMLSNKTTIFLDSKDTPDDSTTTGTYVTSKTVAIPDGAGPKAIETDSAIWGLGSGTGGSITNSIGLCDYLSCDNGLRILLGDGGLYSAGNNTSALYAGINFANFYIGSDYTWGACTARLAFVFDADPPKASYSVSFDIDGEGYGTLSDSTAITVEAGSEITISGTNGNVLTIGESSVTATPTTSTDRYIYSFDGWFNGSTQLQTGDTVNEDLTITAKFSMAIIDTVTLDPGKGTLSGSTTITATVGQPIGELPTPTPKAGYTFTGWFDSEGNEVTSETIVTETESFTLYAQYELDDSLKPVKAMTDLLPLIFVVGIIILMLATGLYYYRP